MKDMSKREKTIGLILLLTIVAAMIAAGSEDYHEMTTDHVAVIAVNGTLAGK